MESIRQLERENNDKTRSDSDRVYSQHSIVVKQTVFTLLKPGFIWKFSHRPVSFLPDEQFCQLLREGKR